MTTDTICDGQGSSLASQMSRASRCRSCSESRIVQSEAAGGTEYTVMTLLGILSVSSLVAVAISASTTYQLRAVTPDEKVTSAGSFGNVPVSSTVTWGGDLAGSALISEVARGVGVSDDDFAAVGTEV